MVTVRRVVAGLALALFALLAAAVPATATPPAPGTTTPAAGAASAAAPVTQAERLAEFLRVAPVYVSDQLPRAVPRSTAPAYAALARRTGVPTYVLVLPDHQPQALLGMVHDRLGRAGLYVLISQDGVEDARAFGVSAPAGDAKTVTVYDVPYDAGPLRSFTAFVDTIASGPARAAQRADQLRTASEHDGHEPPRAYIDRTDRRNQAFLTGIALAGGPLTVLLLGWYARRRRAAAALAASLAAGVQKTPGGGRAALRLPETSAALLLAAVVVLGAPHLFPQTVDSPEATPTRADLSARVDRVADGLLHDGPVYQDPESPHPLDARQTAELRREIAAFTPGRVFVAVVPKLSDDESAGDSGALATALHRRTATSGLYVLADPLDGSIDVYDYGVPLQAVRLTYGLPESIAYDRDETATGDHRIGARLDRLMTYLGTVPRVAQAPSGPDIAPDPLDDHRLPSLYHADFGPGLLVGSMAAGLLLGLVACVTGVVLVLLRRKRRASAAPGPNAPANPSEFWLVRTADHEVAALGEELAQAAADAEGRAAAWDCLDAALLLVGASGAGSAAADGHAGSGSGATPADRAAAIVLARAGRAALAGAAYTRCCTVNPLHGPAAEGAERCAACQVARIMNNRAYTARRLVLPGPRRPRLVYERASGPLPAARRGLRQLIADTKEYAGVP